MAAIWTTLLTTWANKALSITRLNAYLSINGNLQYLKDRIGKVDVAYASENFSTPANPPPHGEEGCWVVQSADQKTFCYTLGEICTVIVAIDDSTIVFSTPSELRIALPVTALSPAGCAFSYYDTANHIGFAQVFSGYDFITLYPDPAHGHFNICSDAFMLHLTLSFPVDD